MARQGRFGGAYPWTIVPLDQRAASMEALEVASVSQDIAPFARFLNHLVRRA